MKDYSHQYPERKFDVMFYVDLSQIAVRPVQAFECPPNDVDVRWVPEEEFYTAVGSVIFRSQRAAEEALKAVLPKYRDKLESDIKTLEEKLQKINQLLEA